MITPFFSHALKSQTLNTIQGHEPYLTFDGDLTRVTNIDDLLWISLSDGTKFTPITYNSNDPIELPKIGESFADIDMAVPIDTDLIGLNALIGSPYNYWGDDDGDDDVTVTGDLRLSIVDKNNETVARNEVLMGTKAPYKLTLTSTNGTLRTRYGKPNSSDFNSSNATYYINPKAGPSVLFATPNLVLSSGNFAGPKPIWDISKGFITQTATPSSYHRNFPTTGANNLYFDLDIIGSNKALLWEDVTHDGITATMTDVTSTSVRVTLTGPYATEIQHESDEPSSLRSIHKPVLPITFELVGVDPQSNKEVVKYGFQLKQWFVNRGGTSQPEDKNISWCENIGYRVPNYKELTNAPVSDIASSTSPSQDNHLTRTIDNGFFAEWGYMHGYRGADFLRVIPYLATDIKINSGTNNGTDSDSNSNSNSNSNNGTDNGTENDANNDTNNYKIAVFAYNGSVIADYSSNQSYHVACVTP
ncbi:hypothetical protein [Gilliamella apis]|uniref:hypothetical protein n=1 Tax=Gilliamella apis TaxID=1970738 RepID=UPI0013F4D595|nr:hypothetical protein [Gilliamella apis]